MTKVMVVVFVIVLSFFFLEARAGDVLEDTKSANDKRHYKYFVLDNKMKVVLVSDSTTEIAAAAVDVGVGSWSDPRNISGLAHFCEHMLFMGTRKFPDEDGYSLFLSQHGGYSNAYTDMTHTNYYFEVASPFLHGALDRFSQFFIAPLFTVNGTEREINAVNSEHSKNINNDAWRQFQLMKSTTNPDHPFSRFSTGNTETLLEIPKRNSIDLHQALLDFHAAYYSANRMTLVIVGKEPLDVLEGWAKEFFEEVKNENKEKPYWTELPLSFPYLQQYYRAVPVQQEDSLVVQWALPPVFGLGCKPDVYISHLLGHEGKGCLLDILKSKGWATSLSAGTDDNFDTWSTFEVSVTLTPAGLEEIPDIVSLIFEMLQLINDSPDGVSEWRYNELRDVSNISYRYLEKEAASDYASSLAAASGLGYSPKDLLDGDYRWNSWDQYCQSEITDMLSNFTVDNLRIFAFSHSFEDLTNRTEHFYGIHYNQDNITDYWIQQWSNVTGNSTLSLPSHNPFIPTDFDMKQPRPEDKHPEPVLFQGKYGYNKWYRFDDSFGVPKADLKILLRTPLSYSSALSTATALMLTELLEEESSKFSYLALLADLSYQFDATPNGFQIDISGYSSRIITLLENFLETFRRICNSPKDPKATASLRHTFQVLKDKQKRALYNTYFGRTYQLAVSYMKESIFSTFWTFEDLLGAIDLVQLDNVLAMANLVREEVTIDILGNGNLLPEDMDEVERVLHNFFYSSVASHSNDNRLVSLPVGSANVYVKRNITRENNSAVIVYFQLDILSKREMVMMEILGSMLYETAFNQLRTKEQLGYIVSAQAFEAMSVGGLLILVQSERDSVYLDGRIESYLTTNFKPFLCSLEKSDFEQYVDGEISKLREPPTNLETLSSEYWKEITDKRYQFSLRKDLINQLQNVTLPEILAFAETYLFNPKTRRRLSIQIQSSNAEVEQPSNSRPPIQDIAKFKQSLSLFSLPTTIYQTPSTPYTYTKSICESSNGTEPVIPSTPTPSTVPTPTPTEPGEEPMKCVANLCLTNTQFYGALIGGGVFLLLIAVAIFFAVRHYISEQNKREMRARMERDEVEGFLSLDQPDANEFSDFSDSQ